MKAPDKQPLRPGFTLIELLAVIAVIAILALISLPSMMQRIARQQVSEALSLADIAKTPIASAWAANQPLPADNAAAGLPAPEKVVSNYVSRLEVETGAIHLVFGNNANGNLRGKTLTLRAAVVDHEHAVPVAWVCGRAPVPQPMTALGTNRTDLDVGYLPLNCR
jgi:type IV pilus assembly protein PilA